MVKRIGLRFAWILFLGLVLLHPQTSAADPSSDVLTFETGKVPLVEIHVSISGDDTSGDGSLAKPYASIGRAVQDATPGSAVRVHAGTYPGDIYVSNLSGTAENPIWVGGAPGEGRPVVEGGGEGLHFSKVRYLIVHDLEVRNTDHNGINTDDGGDYANPDATRHVIFRDLNIHHVGGSGNQDCLKLSGVDDYFVLDSTFGYCGGGFSGSGIDHVGCHNGLVQGNFFERMSGNAVQAKGGSEDITIHANMIVDGGQRTFNIGGSTGFEYFRPPLSTSQPNFEARNIQATANVIQGSVAPLAFVGAVDSLAVNNTIINPTNWLLRILQETTSSGNYEFLPCRNNTVANNLFYFARGDLSVHVNIGPGTDPGTFIFSNNLWYAHDNPDQSQPNLPVMENEGIAGQDPLLINPDGGDFHLQSLSPAIGNGSLTYRIAADFDGFAYSFPPSIGAYEGNRTLPHMLFLPLILRE